MFIRARRRRYPTASNTREADDGTVLVVWAVALTAIMGLVAMAVDLGNVAQTKQHLVNAAQDAVLSAVVDLAPLGPNGGGVPATAEAQAVADAEAYLKDNYPTLTSADFDSCAGLLPSNIYLWPTANCFGFFNPADPSDNQTGPYAMAVATPPQVVRYTFGQALGLHTQQVNGIAYASLATSAGSGILPFGYSSSGGTGLQCLKNGSGVKGGGGGKPTVCSGFTTGSGQFGMLNSPRYVLFPGYSSAASNNPATQTDADIGIDHALNVYLGGSEVCDAPGTPPSCPAYNSSPPYNQANYAALDTGQSLGDLTGALLTGGVTTPDGSCTLEPRFAHPDGFAPSSDCAADNPSAGPSGPLLNADSFGSTYSLNGVPIATYLSQYGQTASSTCPMPAGGTSDAIDDGGVGAGNVWINYDACLSGILQIPPPSGSYYFSSSIEDSPRFGVVPVVTSGTCGGRCAESIVTFYGTYMDLAYPKGGKIGALLAWMFPLSWVAPGPKQSIPLGGGYLGGPFTVNLCSYGLNC